MLLVERNTLGRTSKSMKEAKRDPRQRLTIRELTTEDFSYAAVGIALSLCKLEMGSAESTSIAQCISLFTYHVVELSVSFMELYSCLHRFVVLLLKMRSLLLGQALLLLPPFNSSRLYPRSCIPYLDPGSELLLDSIPVHWHSTKQ